MAIERTPRAALRWAAISGAVMLVFSLILQRVFPKVMGPLPAGIHSPVLAFELARSRAEVETMFGAAASPERVRWVAQMNAGNLYDFGFLIVYAGFLWACCATFPHTRSRFSSGLALAAGAADAIENVCLFAISAQLGGDYEAALRALLVMTWAKWFAIAGCLALLSQALWVRGAIDSRVAALPSAVVLPVAVCACVMRGSWAEGMLLAISLAFFALWIEVLLTQRRAAQLAATRRR